MLVPEGRSGGSSGMCSNAFSQLLRAVRDGNVGIVGAKKGWSVEEEGGGWGPISANTPLVSLS